MDLVLMVAGVFNELLKKLHKVSNCKKIESCSMFNINK